MPSAASADLSRGSKRFHDIDLTFTNSRIEEREKTGGGLSPVAVFVSDIELLDGHTEEIAWEIAPVEWFADRDSGQPRCFVETDADGKNGRLLDVDGQRPYEISISSEAGMLFDSLERHGISPSVMQRLCGEPGLIDGVKIHGVQEVVPGRSFVAKKGAKKGQTVEWTTLVAESVLEDPNTDNRGKGRTTRASKTGGKSAAASKPAAAASAAAAATKPAATSGGAARRPGPRPAPEPEPEPEPESDLSEADVIAIDVISKVVQDPKKNGVTTYSSRQNDGGVTTAQMGQAVMTLYKGKIPPKNDVVNLVRDKDWAADEAHTTDADGNVLYEFEAERGLYFAPPA